MKEFDVTKITPHTSRRIGKTKYQYVFKYQYKKKDEDSFFFYKILIYDRKTAKGWKTIRFDLEEAALEVDKQLISMGLTPVNKLKKKI